MLAAIKEWPRTQAAILEESKVSIFFKNHRS